MGSVAFDAGECTDPSLQRIVQQANVAPAIATGQYDWLLAVEGGSLVLQESAEPGRNSLQVDWVTACKRVKRLPLPRRGPLARALGRRTGTVIDATAGWGQDTILMWMMGYEVVAIERSPVVGALLQDGLRRFSQDECVDRHPAKTPLRLVIAEARTYLAGHHADCVYLDPMFPPKRKSSALARRPLRVLRELVGDDVDRDALFEAAWHAADKRVVVKRPTYAKPWSASRCKPDHTFEGKMMCYDLYVKPGGR